MKRRMHAAQIVAALSAVMVIAGIIAIEKVGGNQPSEEKVIYTTEAEQNDLTPEVNIMLAENTNELIDITDDEIPMGGEVILPTSQAEKDKEQEEKNGTEDETDSNLNDSE